VLHLVHVREQYSMEGLAQQFSRGKEIGIPHDDRSVLLANYDEIVIVCLVAVQQAEQCTLLPIHAMDPNQLVSSTFRRISHEHFVKIRILEFLLGDALKRLGLFMRESKINSQLADYRTGRQQLCDSFLVSLQYRFLQILTELKNLFFGWGSVFHHWCLGGL